MWRKSQISLSGNVHKKEGSFKKISVHTWADADIYLWVFSVATKSD